jgi:adenosylhomocysteinase
MKKFKINLLGSILLLISVSVHADNTPEKVQEVFRKMYPKVANVEWEHKNDLENKLYVLPEELNTEIAALKLQAMGIGIDKLTQEQEAYLHQA